MTALTISGDELHERHERAMALNRFACYGECATYPNCERLSSKVLFDSLISLKKKVEDATKDLIKESSLRDEEYKIELWMKCKEFSQMSLDLGD